MLQPDLRFGIGIPAFWEENWVMKTNMSVHFKRTAAGDRNLWLGRQVTGALQCISSSVFEVTAFLGWGGWLQSRSWNFQTILTLPNSMLNAIALNNLIIFFSLENTNKKDNLKHLLPLHFQFLDHTTSNQDVGGFGEGGCSGTALQFPRNQQRIQMYHPDARQFNQ